MSNFELDEDTNGVGPRAKLAHRRRQNFENSKNQCLGKRDKSSAGRIDPKAVDICGVINDREEYYTTSSCAGRCFLYQGSGIKSTNTFRRFRVSHDKIGDAERYFNLGTLAEDPSGGADPIRSIGQFEHAERVRQIQQQNEGETEMDATDAATQPQQSASSEDDPSNDGLAPMIWLRFEPFILHVACRSLSAASALMNAARPAFKNVGLTAWKEELNNGSGGSNASKYLVAIWGDEGLDMPLCTPPNNDIGSQQSIPFQGHHTWLSDLVNERHQRNWDKIDRFVQAVRDMPVDVVDDDNALYGDEYSNEINDDNTTIGTSKMPKSFDVIGDIAVLNTMPPGDETELEEMGKAMMKKNKAIKIVVARQSTLEGTERAPGTSGFLQLAGIKRNHLITSHAEYGIKCVIDLNHTFFSPRMGPERLRICQQVARGEHVLVLFAGVGMEALQIAGRTEASSVVAVEMNPIAIQCLRRAHQLLGRNKAVKCVGAEERLDVIEGDVLKVIPEQLQTNHFDRVFAPRPKEGSMDGDLGKGDGGKLFLQALLPVMKQNGGECHWYDFVADHEFPECIRTRQLLESCCHETGLKMEVLHVAKAGSVAKRQFRVCVDFRISPL